MLTTWPVLRRRILTPYVPLPMLGSASVHALNGCFYVLQKSRTFRFLFAKMAVWIMTFRTVAAQTAMSKGRNICHCDLLSRQDSRKDQIKYSYFGMHDASWKSQYRSAVCIIGQKEHSSRKHRRTISNDFTSRISNGRWCNLSSFFCQQAGAAVYTPEGQAQTQEQIAYYMNNAKIIREGLAAAGFSASGGVNAPYIWLKTPDKMTSWEFFDYLLDKANVVGTPGSGFGPSGEGYFRLTSFGSYENTLEAVERIKKLK